MELNNSSLPLHKLERFKIRKFLDLMSLQWFRFSESTIFRRDEWSLFWSNEKMRNQLNSLRKVEFWEYLKYLKALFARKSFLQGLASSVTWGSEKVKNKTNKSHQELAITIALIMNDWEMSKP